MPIKKTVDFHPGWIDSFRIVDSWVAGQGRSKCAVVGCQHRGMVMMYWTNPTSPAGSSQDRLRICKDHAITYANRILEIHKFHREDES